MARDATCPECGARLPADATRGLCPACLHRRGLDAEATEPCAGTTDGLGPRPTEGSSEPTADAPASPGGGPDGGEGPPEPGASSFGDYEVIRELGRGGMGVVYLAHNRLMGREEVLKVIGRHIIDRPGVLDRFLQEIRAIARLRHPNIVTAYAAFRCGEDLVLAMEHVEGLDLKRLVKARGPMPIINACYYAHQAALGLQHAYEQGIVHRDIKPSNLVLSRIGDPAVIKVLDFGLAKVRRENSGLGLGLTESDREPEGEEGLTRAGQVLGTPDFMAPEQISDSQRSDIRADIYSLGCTLYYLLSGAPPFQAPTLRGVLQAHLSLDARPLRLVRPDVPAELASMVARMMAKEPSGRFQTPAEIARVLAPFFKNDARVFTPVNLPAAEVTARVVDPAVARVAQTTVALAPVADRTLVPATEAVRSTNRPEMNWARIIEDDETEDNQTAIAVAAKPPQHRLHWFREVLVSLAGLATLALGFRQLLVLLIVLGMIEVFVLSEQLHAFWLFVAGVILFFFFYFGAIAIGIYALPWIAKKK
jgi:hypothetical protein